MITRRGLIGGILAVGCAPAIVRASSLMDIKPIPDDWIKSLIEHDIHMSMQRAANNMMREWELRILDGGRPNYIVISDKQLRLFQTLAA